MTRNRSLRSFYRSARIEPLEHRQLLSVSPTLATIDDVTLYAGAPLYIALDGFDADGDNLTYSISSTNSSITGTVLEGNRSMRIVVEGYGDMIFELFEDRAPNTTSQIIDLVESDFYDGLIFHRIAEYTDGTPFVIQGGDPDGDGSGGPNFQFDDEFDPELLFTSSGLLAMANSGNDTNGSQFFITATDTRHLDFEHSIFGLLTEGESVRQAIQDAEVDSSSKPLDDIVMTSVDIFTDNENGTLMLSAPEGFTGEADITVTVSDGNGGTKQQTFHVTVEADTYNDPPYLENIDPVELTAGGTVTFQLPGYDVEGDELYYGGLVKPSSEDITIDISDTGLVTITATADAAGVYGIFVGVCAYDGSSDWDTASVPVYVAPKAPTDIAFLASSDTGISNEDGLTKLDNELHFRVYGVIDGAEVSIFCDGTMIGQGMASSDGSLVIVSDTDVDLTEGTHQITARQVLRDQAVDIGNYDTTTDIFSDMSTVMDITVDLTAPVISSTPSYVTGVGLLYEYQIELQTPESGVRYSLVNAPAGMAVGLNTGLVQWTPSASAGQMHNIIVKATDTAGNEEYQTYTLYVKQPPVFSSIDDKVVAEENLLEFTVQATPQNGDPTVTYSLGPNVPAGVTINSETGLVSWTPTEAQGPGSYPIVVKATDSDGVNDSITVWVDVTEVNTPPVLDPIADITVNEGETISFQVPVTDPDLPANQLIFTLIGDAPEGLSLHPTTGQLTWTPNEYQGGETFDLTIRVADSAGASDETSFSVSVAEVDDAPVFQPQESIQFVYPGFNFSTEFKAADPDVPTRAVEYSFVGEVPEGMSLDTSTGQVTWKIPEETSLYQVFVSVRASEVLGDGSLGLSSVQTIQLVISRPWLASMEQQGQKERHRDASSSDQVLRDAALAAALSETAPSASGASTRATSSARDLLMSGSYDFTSDEGFFGIQLGTSTAGGTIVQPDTEVEGEKPTDLTSPKKDEKVIPASATEKVSHRSQPAQQPDRSEKISQTPEKTPTVATDSTEQLYYDMTAQQPTLQATAQATTPEEETSEG